jgi:hypothetical protein
MNGEVRSSDGRALLVGFTRDLLRDSVSGIRVQWAARNALLCGSRSVKNCATHFLGVW